MIHSKPERAGETARPVGCLCRIRRGSEVVIEGNSARSTEFAAGDAHRVSPAAPWPYCPVGKDSKGWHACASVAVRMRSDWPPSPVLFCHSQSPTRDAEEKARGDGAENTAATIEAVPPILLFAPPSIIILAELCVSAQRRGNLISGGSGSLSLPSSTVHQCDHPHHLIIRQQFTAGLCLEPPLLRASFSLEQVSCLAEFFPTLCASSVPQSDRGSIYFLLQVCFLSAYQVAVPYRSSKRPFLRTLSKFGTPSVVDSAAFAPMSP